MKPVKEVSKVYYEHHYHISVKMVVAISILVVLVMSTLTPKLESFSSIMYFHAIALGMLALTVCLVLSIFDLQRHEPVIDFPIHYRALLTVILAAVSAPFFLYPSVNAVIAPIPTLLLVSAFIFAFDITGALFIELLFLPRKLFGTYNIKEGMGLPFPKRYIRMFAFKGADFSALLKMNAAYWLVMVSVAALFIAEAIGFVYSWITYFGPSIFSGYIAYLGSNAPGTQGVQDLLSQTIRDPHSHGAAVALMSIAIGAVAEHFHILDKKGWKKRVAILGLWIALAGTVMLTLLYLAAVLVKYSIPTLFQSGPGGVNGIAGDDILITLVYLGGAVTLIPLMLTKLNGKSSWRDSVRLALLGTLFLFLVANTIEGFYMELHHDVFTTTLSANDMAFSKFQPMFGIFFLTIMALVLLAVDYYQAEGLLRRDIGWISGLGLLVAMIGGSAWVFVDPTTGGTYYTVYKIGIMVLGLAIVLSLWAIYKARTTEIIIPLKAPQ